MGGQNPYIQDAEVELPAQQYKITFSADERDGPSQAGGVALRRPRAAREYSGHCVEARHRADQRARVCAAPTCHVVVRQGMDNCSEPSDDEEDQLERTPTG